MSAPAHVVERLDVAALPPLGRDVPVSAFRCSCGAEFVGDFGDGPLICPEVPGE